MGFEFERPVQAAHSLTVIEDCSESESRRCRTRESRTAFGPLHWSFFGRLGSILVAAFMFADFILVTNLINVGTGDVRYLLAYLFQHLQPRNATKVEDVSYH